MKRIAVCLIGQSNENGSGGTPIGYSRIGSPMSDADTGSCSAWPFFIDAAAERGSRHWISVKKTAKGTTAVVRSWAGYPVTWAQQVNGYAIPGQLLLSDGATWRAGGTVGSGGSIATVQPTGTSTTTGADSVPWNYIGPSTAHETAQQIMVEGDRAFDPNGLVAAAYTAVNQAPFDEKWCFISFGQSDAATLSTREQFRDALVSVANFMLARGVRVSIGMSCRANNARYDSHLIPGWQDALAILAPRGVIAGADWTQLGEMSTVTNWWQRGLRDGLHMTPASLRQAGVMWADAAARWL
ncbi:MAG: hypothetical protein AB7K86_08350 [Rhodospirillales bacterium]